MSDFQTEVARKRDLDVIERQLNAALTGGLAFALALLALQGQSVLSIANL